MSTAQPWRLVQLGLVPYQQAWQLQRRLLAARQEERIGDVLLLLEHPHTYTLGRRGTPDHLLLSEQEMAQRGIDCLWVDRGGDITYHGPGQLVGYPICNIRKRGLDVHGYLRAIERLLIDALAQFGIEGEQDPGCTGVWTPAGKVAAIGVKLSRGVSCHGFALNVAPDMSYFSGIIPCGITDRAVTSMEQLLGEAPSMDRVRRAVGETAARVLAGPMVETSLEALLTRSTEVPLPASEPPARFAAAR